MVTVIHNNCWQTYLDVKRWRRVGITREAVSTCASQWKCLENKTGRYYMMSVIRNKEWNYYFKSLKSIKNLNRW